MGEVTPSGPKGGAGIGGAIFGGIIGLIVSVILSLIGLGLTSGFWDTASRGACGAAVVDGIVLLAVSAGLGWLAWHMSFRNTSRTFGAGFLRGLSVVAALFLLIPWPCSYTFAAFMSLRACGH
jgi:high-affinity Fe2+/Pb2+ permease